MSLKHLNAVTVRPLPKEWTPDKRFIDYKYGPLHVPVKELPQGSTSSEQGGNALLALSQPAAGKLGRREQQS